jgi:PAS domain S-box-containing protein
MPLDEGSLNQNRLLLATPTIRDGEITRGLMAKAGVDCVVCNALTELNAQIALGVGAILLSEHSFAAQGIDELIQILGSQPSWSDLPVIVLMQGGTQSAQAARVLQSLGNVTLLERPAPMRSIVSAARAALRARKRQYQMRDQLQEIRHAQAKAHGLQEQLEIAVDASELGTFNCDMTTGRILWNDRCKALFWVAPEAEIDFDLFYSLLHRHDVERVREAVDQCVQNGEPYDIEYRAVSPQGDIRWIRAQGRSFRNAKGVAVRFDVTAQDITERKRAENNLLESQARFQAMANSIPQLAWMARNDGWVFWYNQQWHDYCGSTPEGMEGWGWRSVHDANDVDRVVAGWKVAIESGRPWEDTFRLRRHDGDYRWHLSRARPFRDDQGNIALWFGTNTDVTEERVKAEEREQLLQREQAARLEAERAGRMKDEFLATLSHELRTPLNAILGWSQLLKRADGDTELLAEGISVIERNTRVQVQLIEDLLDMSRIISGKIRLRIEKIEPESFIDAAIETVRPAAQAREVRLTKIIQPRLGSISGDAARLQQAVWNLLSNSIKFTPAGGEVRVAVERPENQIVIDVTDTGIGIDPQFLPHVFERFRQADASTTRAHGGLGLGLAIVKHLVELHGGTVHATSAGEGRGSTFRMSLPVAQHTEALDQPVAAQDEGALIALKGRRTALKGVKILVVDDEPDARRLIKRLLESCDARVFTADSADAAVSIVETEKPDVLLSDIGMPVADGYELLRRVRALGPERGGKVPAIALTAFARSEDRTRALLAGFLLHVSKPVEPRELIATLVTVAARTND